MGDEQHPKPAQGHGQQDAFAGAFPQGSPSQGRGEGGIEVLQHRGGSQGQLADGAVKAEQCQGAHHPAPDQHGSPLAPGIHPLALDHPPAQHQADQGPDEHHLSNRDEASQLFDAQTHQAEAEGAGHHHLRCFHQVIQPFQMSSNSALEQFFDVPILLLTWRRPETTRQVIKAMRKLKPRRVFVASDGPRHFKERIKVNQTRALIESEIDWECDVYKRFNDINLGCRIGVSSAITWFFDHVEEGIILEDDCVAHEDFFIFCRELLDRYREDTRIWCISGDNFQDGQWRGRGSYYFSKYNHCWGWATWKRCWSHYDDSLANLDEFFESGLLASTYPDPDEQEYWRTIWTKLKTQSVPDSWAYRWTFTCISNGGMTALPNRNLVQNIGFGDDALHTKDQSILTSVVDCGITPLTHPCFHVVNLAADQYTFECHFGGKQIKLSKRLDQLVIRHAKQTIKRVLYFLKGNSVFIFCSL